MKAEIKGISIFPDLYANVVYCSFCMGPSVMRLDLRVTDVVDLALFSSEQEHYPLPPWPRLYSVCTSLRRVVHTCSPGCHHWLQQERSVGQSWNTAGGGNWAEPTTPECWGQGEVPDTQGGKRTRESDHGYPLIHTSWSIFVISIHQTGEHPFSHALIGYPNSGYRALVYTKPVNSVYRVLRLATQARDIMP